MGLYSAGTAAALEPRGEPSARPTPRARGVFTLSLDFELIWGTLDLFGDGFRRACEIEREQVVDRLLLLFAEFEIPATWCIVGHLFLERCTSAGEPHPEITRPRHDWAPGDWFARDPRSDEARDGIFYGKSLVEKIRACGVPQEIGSHSFSHVIFGDRGCSEATADSELRECQRLALELGLRLESFAFPRNRVGHLGALRRNGFTCYRGPGPLWYDRDDEGSSLARLAHLFDVLRVAEPPVVTPELTAEGLCNIPGSMIYFPAHGIRRYVPMSLRVRRAKKGLDAAARQKAVFHFWFHPTNLSYRTEDMLAGLREVFAHARALRDRGRLDFLTMGALAAELSPAQSLRTVHEQGQDRLMNSPG